MRSTVPFWTRRVGVGDCTESTSPNPNVILTANARYDVESGGVDARLIALLEAIAARWRIGISVLETGHSKYTTPGSVSLHYSGRAADIYAVNGTLVNDSNYEARSLVAWLKFFVGPWETH